MISIAIDGPAGAGKSTIARALAASLSFIYVDTGALYRTIALYALRKNVDPSDAGQVEPLLDGAVVELRYVDGEQRVLLNGEDVSEEIRHPEISMASSRVSALPCVRSFLFDLQRQMAEQSDVVMDGRDIGTVVLPHAQVKIFLTASAEQRAKRRARELEQKGHAVDFDALLAEIRARDENDAGRPIAPLRQAEDARLVDTTTLTLEQSIAQIRAIAEEILKDVL